MRQALPAAPAALAASSGAASSTRAARSTGRTPASRAAFRRGRRCLRNAQSRSDRSADQRRDPGLPDRSGRDARRRRVQHLGHRHRDEERRHACAARAPTRRSWSFTATDLLQQPERHDLLCGHQSSGAETRERWPGGSNYADWTGGYAQGSNQITLANVGSAEIAVGQYIHLDQANDTSVRLGLLRVRQHDGALFARGRQRRADDQQRACEARCRSSRSLRSAAACTPSIRRCTRRTGASSQSARRMVGERRCCENAGSRGPLGGRDELGRHDERLASSTPRTIGSRACASCERAQCQRDLVQIDGRGSHAPSRATTCSAPRASP